MSADLGRGDVVECVRNQPATEASAEVLAGARTVVIEVGEAGLCARCDQVLRGLVLRDYPIASPWRQWCPCAWRKIGPSRGEIAGLFREDFLPASMRPKVDA